MQVPSVRPSRSPSSRLCGVRALAHANLQTTAIYTTSIGAQARASPSPGCGPEKHRSRVRLHTNIFKPADLRQLHTGRSNKLGNTIDFYLSATRNTKAAKRFLGKALRGLKAWEQPEVLNTDKAPTYGAAIAQLKAEGKCPNETKHRQVKYLNNVVEADHGKLKLLIGPVRGFKTMRTAYATIKGFEVMRALRKGQAEMFSLQGGIVGEARIVERAFGVGPCVLTEAMAWLQDRLASAEA